MLTRMRFRVNPIDELDERPLSGLRAPLRPACPRSPARAGALACDLRGPQRTVATLAERRASPQGASSRRDALGASTQRNRRVFGAQRGSSARRGHRSHRAPTRRAPVPLGYPSTFACPASPSRSIPLPPRATRRDGRIFASETRARQERFGRLSRLPCRQNFPIINYLCNPPPPT
jgi:hypothetical protein